MIIIEIKLAIAIVLKGKYTPVFFVLVPKIGFGAYSC